MQNSIGGYTAPGLRAQRTNDATQLSSGVHSAPVADLSRRGNENASAPGELPSAAYVPETVPERSSAGAANGGSKPAGSAGNRGKKGSKKSGGMFGCCMAPQQDSDIEDGVSDAAKASGDTNGGKLRREASAQSNSSNGTGKGASVAGGGSYAGGSYAGGSTNNKSSSIVRSPTLSEAHPRHLMSVG